MALQPSPNRPSTHNLCPPARQVVTNNIVGETYVLTHCGVAPPPAADFPAGTKFFTVPLVSVSVPTTVPYALLVRVRVPACSLAGGLAGGRGGQGEGACSWRAAGWRHQPCPACDLPHRLLACLRLTVPPLHP